MEERIGEKIEKNILSPEKNIESNKDVFESQNSVIETKEPDKKDLLREIHDKGANIKSGREEAAENKNYNQEKDVSTLVKEFFSIGADKTVKKARKFGAYFLDMFHDELTKRNKK